MLSLYGSWMARVEGRAPIRGCEKNGTGSERTCVFPKSFEPLRGACFNLFTAFPCDSQIVSCCENQIERFEPAFIDCTRQSSLAGAEGRGHEVIGAVGYVRTHT